jgi:predicted nucleic acid-binding protein
MTPEPKPIDILPDTTVWLDYFNPRTDNERKRQLSLFMNNATIWVCPPVFQEVLQGTRSEHLIHEYKATFETCYRPNTDAYDAAEYGAEIYRTLRTKGFTIRKPNDCLIAAYCILNNLALLHHDRDFDTIEQQYGRLVVVH